MEAILNSRNLTACAIGAFALSACSVTDKEALGFKDPTFGEANRATFAAQVINPNPEYDTLVPETSAENATNAIERYRQGQVEQPDRISTTESVSDSPQ